MKLRPFVNRVLVSVPLFGVVLPTNASAQKRDSVCTYRRCALGIAPTWNGLAVVQGVEARRVANLNFFFPRDITPAFSAGSGPAADSTVSHARRAVRLRRFAATFTDVGLLLGGYALSRAAANRTMSDTDKALGIAGAAVFGIGVPLQFAADGDLSRAVWWYNTRFQ